MKTAKEILHEHAEKNKDGFLSGQVKWLVEAMEEYATLCVELVLAKERQEHLNDIEGMREEIKNIRDQHKEQASDTRNAMRKHENYYFR